MYQNQDRIRRSSSDKIIGGVCGGLAKHFNIELVWMRIIFVAFLFMGGSGVLIYCVLWLAIPSDQFILNDTMENNEIQKPKRNEGNIITGIMLIAFGGIFLIMQYFPDIDFRDLWPYLLILAGAFLLLKGFRSNK